MWFKRAKLTAGVATALFAATVLMADDISLDWWTIDGGGRMRDSGGDFELSGTIGQHDASATVLTGGGFELTGGFWAAVQRESPDHPVVTPSAIDPSGPTQPAWMKPPGP